jgi:ribosomal protein S18 acetylase RimI-like enzyme
MLDNKEFEMVGFSRVVTDYTTFAYLTDVYVLSEHQGQGLGRWMMECLNEILNEWPVLRRFMLLTLHPEAAKLYQKTLGVCYWSDSASSVLSILERRGPGVG